METLQKLRWKTSTFTGGEGDCVEAATDARTVFIRDTKARADGLLAIPCSSWEKLLDAIR